MSEEYKKRTDAETDIRATLNRHSLENASNTPDFILAQHLMACLDAFNVSVQQRETWYGRDAFPATPSPEKPAESKGCRWESYSPPGHPGPCGPGCAPEPQEKP